MNFSKPVVVHGQSNSHIIEAQKRMFSAKKYVGYNWAAFYGNFMKHTSMPLKYILVKILE
ncbi:hypothetical protein [Pseudovibrio sp. POLY-S9]|uniref:hypothetical protein n=1 Tax=Pseudovibrio sp. POLY-S9 TaxID=1576596 RepID=UPI0007100D1B|nr:hypothetical protein [Pseudovibrio sp. POLY-S9]